MSSDLDAKLETRMATPRMQAAKDEALPQTVHLPEPTAWPMVLAFGLALVFAGLVTTSALSILGGLMAFAGCVGWFREVLPHEQHETVPVVETAVPYVTV